MIIDFIKTFFLYIAIMLSSCSSANQQVKYRTTVIDSLESVGISFFHQWGYSTHGANFLKPWYKDYDDGSGYSCTFRATNSNIEILITHPTVFANEQKIRFDLEALTAKAYPSQDSIFFTKLN